MSDFRKGVCQDCDAEFQIPLDFPHDRARCRECETGVVVIEPAPGAAPAAAAPEPKPKQQPADGMSMKEKIIARKKAEAEAQRAQAKPAAKPVPAAKPKPKPAAKPKPVARRKAKDGDDEKPARAGRSSRAGAGRKSARTGAKAGARGSRGKRGESGSGERRGRRAAKEEEKKKPVGAIIAVLVLVLGGVGAWAFLYGPLKSEEPQDQVATGGGDDAAETNLDDVTAGAEDAAGEDATGMDSTESMDTTDDATDAAAEDATDDAGEDAAADEPEEAPEEKTYDPSEVSYDEYPVYGPAVGTTEEEWEDIQLQAERMFDPSGGARQSRAVKALREYRWKAYPAIMNEMRKVDLGTMDAYVLGDMFNQMMVFLQNGRSANWVYTRDEETGLLTDKAQYNNRLIVRVYLKSWSEIVEDPTAWVPTAKLNQEKYADQLEEYAQAVLDAGITEGDYIDIIEGAVDGSGGGGDDDLDDLDDF